MATDFFERQSAARRNTAWLIAMFLLAAFSIVASTFVVVLFATQQLQGPSRALGGPNNSPGLELPLLAAGGALAMVAGGTLFKVVELRASGGTGVAARLGGHRLDPGDTKAGERRLLNVVEEMAIASGVPVPPVFLLEESGINAFAAGYSTSDAVIGVTRGAVEQLSRDELQGVIAHEFSHILNGDMRMSIRLIGILHGILLLGLTGRILLRSMAYSGRGSSRDRGNGILLMLGIGVALLILGFVGTFLGGLMKAAVSRQREYLADASAVQFTRNPGGIAGALERIALRSPVRKSSALGHRSESPVLCTGCVGGIHRIDGYAPTAPQADPRHRSPLGWNLPPAAAAKTRAKNNRRPLPGVVPGERFPSLVPLECPPWLAKTAPPINGRQAT